MSFMKKTLCLLLPATLLLSCAKDTPAPEDRGFSLRAAMEEVRVKNSLGPRGTDNKTPIYWADGDEISVNGVISRPLSGQSGASSSAVFDFGSTPASASVYNVLYPGTSETDRLSFDGKRIPLYGSVQSLSSAVSLRTPSCVIRFKIKGSASLTGLRLSSVGGERIAGGFTLAKDAGGAFTGVLIPASDASSHIDYSFEEPFVLTPEGRTVVLVIPAGNYSKGLMAVVSDNAGKSMTLRFFVSGAVLPAAQVSAFQSIEYSAGSEVVATEAEGFGSEDIALDTQGGLPDLPSESGQNMVSIKAGTYNIWSPEARKTVMDEDPEVSEQRSWANSYEAVAAMINYLDCDVMGLQEVSSRAFRTTLTGPREDYDGNIHTLNEKIPAYKWVIYNAHNTTYDNLASNTTANGLGSTDAILYKSSVLQLEASGRYWITGTKKKAPQDDPNWSTIQNGGTNRPATWAKFTHKASGKQFYFITTHLDLPNAGPSEDPLLPQRRNASELIEWFAPLVVQDGLPSIICGDMNTDTGECYEKLNSGVWKDVYDSMKAIGTLEFTDLRYPGTMNADKRESGIGTWRPDHILTEGFSLSYYKVGREKFATKDGTMHYPSDHLPIKVILNF